MSIVVFWLFMGLYLGGFCFFTYVCMVADPNESKLAYFWSVKLPQNLSRGATKIVGKETVGTFNILMDYALVLVYLAVVLGCWSVIFFFVYPWMDSTDGYISSGFHKTNGYIVFIACMTSWRYASSVSPGIITKYNLAKFDNYPCDGTLFIEGRICPTVGIPKLARSKFDRFSGIHVARFDHFCGWLHNPIGEENYRFFLLFLAVHVGMCLYGSIVVGYLFQYEITKHKLWEVTFYNVSTGAEFNATWFVVIQYLFQKHQVCAGVYLVMAVMCVVLGLFLGWHCWISSRGMTTNETSKWGQVKKWHKKETKRYQEAVKAGTVAVSSGKEKEINKPIVSDGDVTCVPGTAAAPEQDDDENEDDDKIRDPGPMPRNIYNRGVIENWKDIIFPRSLRPDALERYRKSRQQQQNQEAAPNKPKAS